MAKRRAPLGAVVALSAAWALVVAGCGPAPGTVPPPAEPGGFATRTAALMTAEDLEATLKAEATRQLSAAVLDVANAFTAALEGDRAGTLAHLNEAKAKLEALKAAPLAAAQRAIVSGVAKQVDKAIAKVNDQRTNVQLLAVRIAGAVQEALEQVRQTLSLPGEGE